MGALNMGEDGDLDENEEKKGDDDDREEDDERDHGPSTAANQSAISAGLAQNASAMSAAEKINATIEFSQERNLVVFSLKVPL